MEHYSHSTEVVQDQNNNIYPAKGPRHHSHFLIKGQDSWDWAALHTPAPQSLMASPVLISSLCLQLAAIYPTIQNCLLPLVLKAFYSYFLSRLRLWKIMFSIRLFQADFYSKYHIGKWFIKCCYGDKNKSWISFLKLPHFYMKDKKVKTKSLIMGIHFNCDHFFSRWASGAFSGSHAFQYLN